MLHNLPNTTAVCCVLCANYSFSQSLWCFSQIRMQILITISSTSTRFNICAHHTSNFSFLGTNCKRFWTCVSCFHTILCCFITLSFAYVMSVKMNYTYGCWIVVPNKTNSLHFIASVITYKIVELGLLLITLKMKVRMVVSRLRCLHTWHTVSSLVERGPCVLRLSKSKQQSELDSNLHLFSSLLATPFLSISTSQSCCNKSQKSISHLKNLI